MDMTAPSEEHQMLREMVRSWVLESVEPQALDHDKNEKLNLNLLRSMGEMGLLGITVPEKYGGAGMDTVAAVIVHEEIGSSDPAFGLSYLANSMLCVNNFAESADE